MQQYFAKLDEQKLESRMTSQNSVFAWHNFFTSSAARIAKLSISKSFSALLFSLIAISLSGCETTNISATNSRAADVAPLFSVPYRTGYGGRPIISTTVNGKGPFDFVLDTASSNSAVYRNLLASLDLDNDDTNLVRVFSLNGVEFQPTVTLNSIELGPASRQNLRSVVFDDWIAPEQTPQGLIGLDVLEDTFMLVDVEKGVIEFYDPDNPPNLRGAGWRWSRLAQDNFGFASRPLYKIRTQTNGHRFYMLLDTGSEVSLGNLKFANILRPNTKRIRFVSFGSRIRDVQDQTATILNIPFKNLRASGIRWDSGRIYATNARIFDDLGYAATPFGILGIDLIGARSFAIDFRNHRFYVAPGKFEMDIEAPTNGSADFNQRI